MSNEVVWETCPRAGCGYSPYPMEKSYNERVRRTGESFLCPAGHSAVYNGGLTADRKRIKELESQLQFWKKTADWYQAERDRLRASCQWIDCGFVAKDTTGLATHMRARHGMPTLAVVREAS